MLNQTDHDSDADVAGRPERVVIEDYRGPGVVLPTAIPQAWQNTVLPEAKQEAPDITRTQAGSSLNKAQSWANISYVCGVIALAGLFLPSIINLNRGQFTIHVIVFSPVGMVIFALSLLGFMLGTLAFFQSRAARSAGRTPIKHNAGLELSSMALAVVLLVYFFGWY